MCVTAGCKVLIAIPGERRGMSREEGADNAVAILNRVKGYAEQKNINVCMEITNSKVAADQRTDQIFDHMAWGLDVVKRVNSPRVKILYDIYHAQVADGDYAITSNGNVPCDPRGPGAVDDVRSGDDEVIVRTLRRGKGGKKQENQANATSAMLESAVHGAPQSS